MLIQLFRERLSCKREKLTRQCRNSLWVIVVFMAALSERQGVTAWWNDTAQTRIRAFSFLVAESP